MRRMTLLAPLLALALVSAAGGVGVGAARPSCGGKPATKWKPDFIATDGVAWFFADGDGRDVIVGTNGRDRVEGSGGGDLVCTRNGADVVNAYNGDDRIWGAAGADVIDGGAGDDTVKGGGGPDGLSDRSGPNGEDAPLTPRLRARLTALVAASRTCLGPAAKTSDRTPDTGHTGMSGCPPIFGDRNAGGAW